jgi:hypothetical protein
MAKERYQNPVVGDLLNLRLFAYNSNNFADFREIEEVNIYYLDPAEINADNPDGRRLVESFNGDSVTSEDTGQYLLQTQLEQNVYVIGRYCDVWTVSVFEDQPSQTVEQYFEIYPALWYTTPMPIVYDFSFNFQPNKFRQNSKQYLIIEITPNVPRASDLRAYYENLAIVSDLKLTIEQRCGDCLPAERDARVIVEEVSVDYREKRFGYYQLDTADMECGIYDVTFRLDFGGNRYISDKHQFQIY